MMHRDVRPTANAADQGRLARRRCCQRCRVHRPRRLVICLWGCGRGGGSGCVPPHGPCLLAEFVYGYGACVDCLPPGPPWLAWRAAVSSYGPDRVGDERSCLSTVARHTSQTTTTATTSARLLKTRMPAARARPRRSWVLARPAVSGTSSPCGSDERGC